MTNGDRDLVIARVDDAGQVSVSEFDHEGATSALANDVTLKACLVGRGASRALLLYTAKQDKASGAVANNTSLFARAVYLDGSAAGSTWPNVVSGEVRVNATTDATTTAPSADVTAVWTAENDPFCAPQYNNDAFYVAFKQQIEGDADGQALRYARLEMSVPADVSASSTGKVTLAATEATIEPLLDTGWSANSGKVALAEAGIADGAVVFYGANGNNRANNTATSTVAEARVYAWANQLPDATSGPPALAATEVSSLATGLPSNWMLVKDWELHVTPLQAASRDYALDTDTAPAEFAHLFLRERDGTTNSPMILRGRAMDLRRGVATVAAERFFPAPNKEPEMVSSGRHGRTNSDMWDTHSVVFHGNALVATFAENAAGSGGPDVAFGQVFVNTFSPETRSWSDAAILSNETREDVYSEGNKQWVKLTVGGRNGCPDALGAWIFWTKAPAGDTDDDETLATYLQGRRFTSVALPSR